MARFRFHGTHKRTAEPATGYLESADREAASAALLKRGIVVRSLEEQSGEMPDDNQVSQSLASDRQLIGAAGLLLVIGLLHWGWSLTRQPLTIKSSALGTSGRVHLKVTGHLTIPPKLSPDLITARIEIREIPLEVARQGKQLFVDKDGNFVIETRFESPVVPTTFAFSAEARGFTRMELNHLNFEKEQTETETQLSCALNNCKLAAKRSESFASSHPFHSLSQPRPTPQSESSVPPMHKVTPERQ